MLAHFCLKQIGVVCVQFIAITTEITKKASACLSAVANAHPLHYPERSQPQVEREFPLFHQPAYGQQPAAVTRRPRREGANAGRLGAATPTNTVFLFTNRPTGNWS